MSVGRVHFQYPFLKRIQITAKGKRLPVTHDVPKAFISAVSTIFCFCPLYQISEFYFIITASRSSITSYLKSSTVFC